MSDYRPNHNTLKELCEELVQKKWITSRRVYDVMMRIDRKDFAPRHPYENNPQPIPCNTVISAPLLHAYSLEALKDFLKPGNKVLDVGSGSGYLTLAMSKMMNDEGCVIGIDHMEELIDFGIQNISKHNKNLIDKKRIKFILGDGNNGCKQEAPFDCIHVGAVAEKPPEALLKQLKVGGRMIMPLHNEGNQFIYIIDKKNSESFEAQEGLSVKYSPLTTVYDQLNNVKIKSEEKNEDQSKKETQKEKNKDHNLKEENKKPKESNNIIDKIDIENQKLIEENIVLRETIDTLRKENKNLQQKLSGENNNLKETINSLKQENKNLAQKFNKEIEKLKEKINSQEKEINDKSKEIQNLLLKNNNQYNPYNLNENAISSIKPGEKIIAVNFRSMGNHEIVSYCLPCKNTDLFVRLEEKLYNDYPNFKNYETYFEVDTRRIKRFKTMDENKIKGNDIISMFVVEE